MQALKLKLALIDITPRNFNNIHGTTTWTGVAGCCIIEEMTVLGCGGDTWWLEETEELSNDIKDCNKTCSMSWGKATVVAVMAYRDGL